MKDLYAERVRADTIGLTFQTWTTLDLKLACIAESDVRVCGLFTFFKKRDKVEAFMALIRTEH